jgi:hypothetical protein
VRVQSLAVTVVSWVASDTAGWIFLGLGVLCSALAIGGTLFPVSSDGFPSHGRIRLFFGHLSVWSPAVVGPLLLLIGAVLVGTGAGRLSWLSIFSGAVCLLTFAFLRLEKANQYSRGREERHTSRLRGMEERLTSQLDEMDIRLTALERTLRRLSEPARYPSPSKIAEEVSQQLRRHTPPGPSLSVIVEEAYRNLVEKGVLPSPSEIADGAYWKRNVKGELPSRTVGNFEDFANSMVDAGQ